MFFLVVLYQSRCEDGKREIHPRLNLAWDFEKLPSATVVFRYRIVFSLVKTLSSMMLVMLSILMMLSILVMMVETFSSRIMLVLGFLESFRTSTCLQVVGPATRKIGALLETAERERVCHLNYAKDESEDTRVELGHYG